MCKKILFWDRKYIVIAVVVVVVIIIIITVSYTHLDVYKRQDYRDVQL